MGKYYDNIKYQKPSRSSSERDGAVLWITESRLRNEKHEYTMEEGALVPLQAREPTPGGAAAGLTDVNQSP